MNESPGPPAAPGGPLRRGLWLPTTMVSLFAMAMVAGVVAFPRAGAALDVVPDNGWSTSATPRPVVVRQGGTITFDVTVTSDKARSALVDVEINDPSGRKVFQDYWDEQAFAAATPKTYSTTWQVPGDEELGGHVVHVGVFIVGWGVLYDWNHAAASFVVQDAGPPAPTPTSVTTTTVPAPTTTHPANTTTTTPTTTTTTTTTTPPPTTTTSPPTTTTTTTTPPAAGTQFSASFATSADFYDRFQTHVGNDPRPETLPPGVGVTSFPGDHDMNCDAPTTQRTVNVANHDELFWWCGPRPSAPASSGHVMTGLETSGYAIVSFTPNRTFTNVSRVCWDQNLTDLGGGKWTNVVLVPEATYQRNGQRLDYVSAGFNDPNGPGSFNLQGNGDIFGVKQFRGTLMLYRGDTELFNSGSVWTAGDDKSTRYQHCMVDNGNGTITLTQARADGTESYTTSGSFPDGQVRVIFQDDNYDTIKHDGRPGFKTWHWDNINIT